MTYAGVQTDFWEIQCKRRYYVVIIRTLYQIQIFPYYSTNNVSFDFPLIVTKLSTLNCTRNHFNSKYFVAADYVVPRCSIVLPVFLKRTNYFSVLVPLGDISFPFTLFKHDLVNKTFHSTICSWILLKGYLGQNPIEQTIMKDLESVRERWLRGNFVNSLPSTGRKWCQSYPAKHTNIAGFNFSCAWFHLLIPTL